MPGAWLGPSTCFALAAQVLSLVSYSWHCQVTWHSENCLATWSYYEGTPTESLAWPTKSLRVQSPTEGYVGYFSH